VVVVVGVVVVVVVVVGGLTISFHYNTAGSATMSGLSVLMFFVVFVGQELRASMRRRNPALA